MTTPGESASMMVAKGRTSNTCRALILATRITRIGVMSAVVVLSACALRSNAPPAEAPHVEGLPEFMHQAETAAAAGDKDKARDAYRSAAKAEPTSKLPWLKLSESYFEGGDYGNAVLAAQEVLHRDNADSIAAGILAVSGLRVSTSALAVLRQQNSINSGTRSEAETLTRNLRELLGEQVLVPRPIPEPVVEKPARPRARSATSAAAAASAATSRKSAATPPTATTATSGNPFDKLK